MHAWINITHPGFSGRQDMPDDGDQWVSWEQMVAQLRAKGDAEGRAALLAREVIELRGEVAKLKHLEFLLLKGGDPVQHLSEAVLDLSAKLRQMEEASRLDQSEILRMTRCIAELQANLIAVVEPTAVVVPELTDDEIHARLIKLFPGVGEDAPEREWCFKDSRWAYNLAASRAHAIPADRVLGEGKVAVGRKTLEDISRRMDEQDELFAKQQRSGKISLSEAAQLMQTASQANGPTIDYSAEDAEKEMNEWREYNANERRRQRDLDNESLGIDTLRANQGGAAT